MLIMKIHGDPIAWKRPAIAPSGHVYDPQKKEKELLRWKIRGEIISSLIQGPIKLSMQFSFSTPSRLSKRTVQEIKDGSYYHMVKPDIDNLVKFYLDTLTGVIWEDDRQIFSLSASKEYAQSPLVLIKILDLSWRVGYSRNEEKNGKDEGSARDIIL